MKLYGYFTFLGYNKQTSAKTGNAYVIINLCDESGSVLSCLVSRETISTVEGLTRFNEYKFTFAYNSNYKDLKVVDCE